MLSYINRRVFSRGFWWYYRFSKKLITIWINLKKLTTFCVICKKTDDNVFRLVLLKILIKMYNRNNFLWSKNFSNLLLSHVRVQKDPKITIVTNFQWPTSKPYLRLRNRKNQMLIVHQNWSSITYSKHVFWVS